VIEGYDESNEDASLFVRRTVEAMPLPDGAPVTAYSYFFNHPVDGELIAHGDYRVYRLGD
jgi:gamma-glutamylcyclotransferase (GGCT)/AIG2-like uncharacterized protein YtfP